jgi:DNA-binding beta-propeller fold protein YncE
MRKVMSRALLPWLAVAVLGCSEGLADFARPTAVAFAPNGEIYVADGYDHGRIVRFDADGCALGSFGERGLGRGQFETPHGIAIGADSRVYVADRDNERIQVFEGDGRFVAAWFSPELGYPWAVAIGPDEHVYVADGGDQTPGGAPRRIVELDTHGNMLGAFGHEDAALQVPHGLALGADGSVYVADLDGRAVRKFVRR